MVEKTLPCRLLVYLDEFAVSAGIGTITKEKEKKRKTIIKASIGLELFLPNDFFHSLTH